MITVRILRQFLFRSILLQLHIIIFQERIFDRFSLGAKERGLGANSGWKIRDSAQKYNIPKSEAWHGPCHISHGRDMSQDSLLLLFAS